MARFGARAKNLIQVSKLDSVADWNTRPGAFSKRAIVAPRRSSSSLRVSNPARFRSRSS